MDFDGNLATSAMIDLGDELPTRLRGGVATIGNFDGVHRGHARLLAAVRQRAADLHVPAIAVTFDPHPLALLRPQSVPAPLCTPDRKRELLLACGADAVLVIRTTPALLSMSADAFFEEFLVRQLHVGGLVEGPNFGFGKGRSGDIERLRQLCTAASIPLDVVPPALDQGLPISSSRVRRAIDQGDVTQAARWLGRHHRVTGEVVVGQRRGRTLGFPTANLNHTSVLIPADGVYATWVHWEGMRFAGACNVGPNPTFGETARKIEIHLIDFDGDLYGELLHLDFLRRIRETRPFHGADELRRQLADDVRSARDVAETIKVRSERCLAIEEWIRLYIEPGLVGRYRLKEVDLNSDGVVHVKWLPEPDPLLPSDFLLFLQQIEEGIRSAFPMVRAVQSQSEPANVGRSTPSTEASDS